MKFDKILPGKAHLALDGGESARERLDAMAELSSEVLWETDADLRLSYVSTKYSETIGTTARSAIGKTLWKVSRSDLEADPEWKAIAEAMAARAPFSNIHVHVHHKDGDHHRAEISGKPFFDPQGIFLGYRGVSRNISQTEKAQEALSRSRKRLLAAHKIAKISHWETDLATQRAETFGSVVSNAGLEGEVSEEEVLASIHPDDVERISLIVGHCEQDGVPFNEVYRRPNPDGSTSYIRAVGEAVRDDDGNIIKTRGTLQDVTEQVRNEQELQKAHDRLIAAQRSAKISYWDFEAATREFITHGDLYSSFNIEGRITLAERFKSIHPDDVEWVREAFTKAVKDGREFEYVYRMRDDEGTVSYIHAIGAPICGEDGAITGMRGTTQDVTDLVRAEEAAKSNEQRAQAIFNNVADAVATIDESGIVVSVNAAFEKTFGYAQSEIAGQNISMIMPEPFRSEHNGYIQNYLRTGVANILDKGARELTALDSEGQIIPVELTIGETYIGDRRIFVGSLRDIRERKQAENALTESEERYRSIVAALSEGVVSQDARGRILDWNAKAAQILGLPGNELQGLASDDDRWEAIREDGSPLAGQDHPAMVVLRTGKPAHEVMAIRHPEKGLRWLEVSSEPVFNDASTAPTGVVTSITDITERKEAEEALQRSEERYMHAARYGRMAVWEIFPEEEKIVSDNNMKALMGMADDAPPLDLATMMDTIHEDDFDQVSQAMQDVFEGRTDQFSTEHRTRRVDGTYTWHRDQGYVASKPGEPMRIVGTSVDVSAQKEAEEQLAQAQKMDAVGQLTGGVAHDFNNLLAIITGNLELLAEELTLDERNAKMINTALSGARRGADLTKRLLAFSRRQALAPQFTDINALTSNMLDLARRTLGEAIEVAFEPSEDAWHAQIDPGQLENALLNLGINARDAMPGGGFLTFRTHNVSIADEAEDQNALSPGDYVVVEVSDTGTGMAPDVLEKVFEPFFTTKDVGQGTGLGLSMVYGFVKQSGGHVSIDSTPGKGTAVSLYLPRATQNGAARSEDTEASGENNGAGETILVVEDDPDVRELVVSLIEAMGYTALEAGDAESALEILKSDQELDILFTDVVLGKGVNGAELAKVARERRPELKILLMSGYTKDDVTEEIRALDLELLAKPFTKVDLAASLCRLLGPTRDSKRIRT